MKMTEPPRDIDTYIADFPAAIREQLILLRETIREAAPAATEKISYGIPTFYLEGNLVHFAGYKAHIGFYPAPSGIAAFKEALAVYPQGKGSIQFPLDQPLPLELVTRIVQYRVTENLAAAAGRTRRKRT
ncbi:MAG: DUF1801 domain-containing protein [Bacteroidia bacterium]|nr:DUF1801 domain-containing protein [Bacteroidia bacterium]